MGVTKLFQAALIIYGKVFAISRKHRKIGAFIAIIVLCGMTISATSREPTQSSHVDFANVLSNKFTAHAALPVVPGVPTFSPNSASAYFPQIVVTISSTNAQSIDYCIVTAHNDCASGTDVSGIISGPIGTVVVQKPGSSQILAVGSSPVGGVSPGGRSGVYTKSTGDTPITFHCTSLGAPTTDTDYQNIAPGNNYDFFADTTNGAPPLSGPWSMLTIGGSPVLVGKFTSYDTTTQPNILPITWTAPETFPAGTTGVALSVKITDAVGRSTTCTKDYPLLGASLPDLTILSARIQTDADVGTPLHTWIENIGVETVTYTGTHNMKYEIFEGSTSECVTLLSEDIKGMAPGDTREISIDLTTQVFPDCPLITGSQYTLVATIDPDNIVTEEDETNNSSFSVPFTYTGDTNIPPLPPTGIKISGEVRVLLSNWLRVPGAKVMLFDQPPGDDISSPIASTTTNANGYFEFLNLVEGSTYDLRACYQINNVSYGHRNFYGLRASVVAPLTHANVFPADDVNGICTDMLPPIPTPSSLPDLTILSARIQLDADVGTPLHTWIENIGAETVTYSGTHNMKYEIFEGSTSECVTLLQEDINNMAPGDTREVSIDLTAQVFPDCPLITGSQYTLVATIDPDNIVTEEDETNNSSFSVPFTYTGDTNIPPPYPHCTPLGDIDCSGEVRLADLQTLLANFNTSYPPADFDDSGEVKLNDLSTLLSNFGFFGL